MKLTPTHKDFGAMYAPQLLFTDTLITDEANDTLALEAYRELALLDRKLQTQQSNMKAIESAILTLESHQGPLSSFQLKMLGMVARHNGVEMGHQRVGLTLEAYSGPRASTILALTLEGFKDAFKKALEWVIKILRKMKAWLTSVFDYRVIRLKKIRDFLRTPGMYRTPMPSESALEAIESMLSIDNVFSPSSLVRNVSETAKSLGSNQYHSALQQYCQEVESIVKDFLTDAASASPNWRRHVDKVNGLEMPVPPRFEQQTSHRTEATYSSPPMIQGSTLQFHGLTVGNDLGAKGARQRAQALSEVRLVGETASTEAQGSSDALDKMHTYVTHSAFHTDTSSVEHMLDDAISMIKNSHFLIDLLDRNEKAMQSLMHHSTADLAGDANSIVNHLIHSIGAVSRLSSKMVTIVGEQASHVGMAWTHLVMLERRS